MVWLSVRGCLNCRLWRHEEILMGVSSSCEVLSGPFLIHQPLLLTDSFSLHGFLPDVSNSPVTVSVVINYSSHRNCTVKVISIPRTSYCLPRYRKPIPAFQGSYGRIGAQEATSREVRLHCGCLFFFVPSPSFRAVSFRFLSVVSLTSIDRPEASLSEDLVC